MALGPCIRIWAWIPDWVSVSLPLLGPGVVYACSLSSVSLLVSGLCKHVCDTVAFLEMGVMGVDRPGSIWTTVHGI